MLSNHIEESYPEEYIKVLTELEHEASSNGIASGSQKKYFGRLTWWTFVKDIKLVLPSKDICNECGIDSPTTSFQEFLSDSCQGNIKRAIYKIDRMIKLISFMVDITKEFKLLVHLQQVSSFLRDMEIIIDRYKHRPERTVDIENEPINKSLILEVNPLDPDAIRAYSAHFDQYPNYIRTVQDSRPTGPSSPSFLVAGFCIVCHRYCKREDFYCEYHTKSKGNESEIRSKQRMMNKAFENLGMKLPFEKTINTEGLETSEILKVTKDRQKELKLSNAQLFHSRCYRLIGWAKTTNENKSFNSQLRVICPQYFENKTNDDWPIESISIFMNIVQLTKEIPHSRNIFHSSFLCGDSIFELKKALNQQVFGLSIHAEYSVSTAITMLIGIQQFNLIKLASQNRYKL